MYWYVFRIFEGVLGCGIYDNMCMVVDCVGVGKKCDVNVCFMVMISYYVFEFDFCSLVVGWEKG